MRFHEMIRPRGVEPTKEDREATVTLDLILVKAPLRDHASWYRTFLSIRRLRGVGE